MRRARATAWAVLAALSVVGSGCELLILGTGAAVGAGAVVYLKGELKATKEATLAKALAATEGALKELKLAVTDRREQRTRIHLIARGEGDKRIEINLRKVSESLTEIGIRVGVLGDESLSRLILGKIEKRL